jgi:hypothetical protein
LQEEQQERFERGESKPKEELEKGPEPEED